MNDRHTDEEFIERLKREVNDYNTPPDTPREVMWARIQEARSIHKETSPARTPGWWLWPRRLALPAAVAALVVLAFVIGRHYAPKPGGEATAPQMAAKGTARGNEQKKRYIYGLAAAPVLTQAEVLLTQFKSTDTLNGDRETYAERAATLLVDTRYLLNTPAADDPKLRQLLSDLELVLAQIVQLSSRGGHEKEFADESISGRFLIERLRTESNAGPAI